MVNNLQYINHDSIDKALWDEAIEASANGLIYAQSAFLDAMSPGWDALISNGYEYVMPLTWRKKWGIRYLCQPAFAQQLGIFSRNEVQLPIQTAFLEAAAQKYRLIEIFLNHGCLPEPDSPLCNNFLVPVQRLYEAIREDYSKDLLKNLNRTQKFDLQYKEGTDTTEAITIYRDTYGKNMGYRPTDWEAFDSLCKNLFATGDCFLRKVVRPMPHGNLSEELLAIGLFLKDKKRIYNVASTTLPNGRMMEANHFLMDELIREFAGTDLILDFEGSDLPGVARFYKKFGSINQPYFFWKKNTLPTILKWIKS